MGTELTLSLMIRLTAAFIAAFPAIALWSRTRDPAWMLVVLGTLFLFADSLFFALVSLGVASYDRLLPGDLSLVRILMAVLPYFLLAAGFVVFLVRKRRY